MATTVQNPFDTQQQSATNQNPTQQTSSTGLVASNLPQNNQAMTYAPETRQVSQPTETVQGQVDSILATDSPLMQRARTMATQQMAQRGLVNSSMAQGAGVAAMVDRALPIAQQDANTYNTVSSENMAARNRAGEVNAGLINQFSLQRGAQEFTAGQAGLDRAQQTALQQGQQQFQAGESSLDRAQQLNVLASQQGFQADQSTLDRAQQLLVADKNISAQQALQIAQQEFQAGQSSLDRTQQTNIVDRQAAIQQDLTSMQQSFAASQSALDRAQQAYMADRTAENQMALQNAQQSFTASQASLDRAQQAYMQSNQQAFQTSLTQMQQSFTAAQAGLDRQQQAFLQDDAQAFQTNMQNTTIPANFALQINASTMQSINAIAADPNLSGTVDNQSPAGSSPKSRAISSALNYANSQISWANKFYSTNIPGLPTA